MSSKRLKNGRVKLSPQTDGIEPGWLGETIGFNLRIAHEASVRAYLQSIAENGAPAWRFAI
jgi:hypothetical protein